MNSEEYKQLKDRYEYFKSVIIGIKFDYNQLTKYQNQMEFITNWINNLDEEVLNNKEITELKRLQRELVEAVDNYSKKSLGIINDKSIVNAVYDSVEIGEKNTNEIYIYMGSYKHIYYPKNGVDYYKQVPIDDNEVQYIMYQNIEEKYGDYKIVKIGKREDFEKERLILFAGDENVKDYYDRVRNTFFETAIHDTQESAVKKIEKVYKKDGDLNEKGK